MVARLEMLVPVEFLPAEGEDLPGFQSTNGHPTRLDLLRYYLELTGDNHLGFRVGRDGIEILNGAADGVPLQHSHFLLGKPGQNEGQPWFDFSDRTANLDVSPILAQENGVELTFGDDAGPEDYLRVFLAHFTTRLEEALGEIDGTAIPLLRWRPSDGIDAVDVGFCGVVVADRELLESLREGGPDGIAFDEALGLVLEQPEVEGRGLREVALSLAVLGIAIAATPQAEAGSKRFGSGSAVTASSQGSLMAALSGVKLFDYNKHGEKIETIRANQHQEPARINRTLLDEAGGSASEVVIDVGRQRAYVIVNGEIAIDTPVSTAREGKYTPRGEFTITQRVRTGKTSTIYGCDLPYWMRLGESPVGMHVGDLPGYPASAGCVRLPQQVAPIIFEATASGTTVRIVDSWQPDTMLASM